MQAIWNKVLVVAVVIAPCITQASGGVYVGGGFYTGNSFMSMSEMQRDSVLAAMATMLTASGLAGSPTAYQVRLNKCLTKVYANQLSAALENYLKSQPEQWDQSLGAHIVFMLDAFCEKRGIPLKRDGMFAR